MITIERVSSYSDRFRKYKVVLDGQVIGKISNNERKPFNVEPGEHALRMRIDWCGSKKIKFQSSASDENINFRCKSSLADNKAWLAIVYVLFLPFRYVLLERIN